MNTGYTFTTYLCYALAPKIGNLANNKIAYIPWMLENQYTPWTVMHFSFVNFFG